MSEYLKLFSRRLELRKDKSCGQQKAAFVVYARDTEEVVGTVSLNMKAESVGLVGELDVNIDTAFSGQGYSIEAMKRLSEYAYEDLGLVKLYAKAPNMNLAAEYTLRRVGFSALNKLSKDGSYKYFEAISPFFVSQV